MKEKKDKKRNFKDLLKALTNQKVGMEKFKQFLQKEKGK